LSGILRRKLCGGANSAAAATTASATTASCAAELSVKAENAENAGGVHLIQMPAFEQTIQ
jgi:hypothetical protein